jgi:hypothetical protein
MRKGQLGHDTETHLWTSAPTPQQQSRHRARIALSGFFFPVVAGENFRWHVPRIPAHQLPTVALFLADSEEIAAGGFCRGWLEGARSLVPACFPFGLQSSTFRPETTKY